MLVLLALSKFILVEWRVTECQLETSPLHLCIPIPLPFDLTHGPCAPAVVSGGMHAYCLDYPHALGINPLTSLSFPHANAHDQLYVIYPPSFH